LAVAAYGTVEIPLLAGEGKAGMWGASRGWSTGRCDGAAVRRRMV